MTSNIISNYQNENLFFKVFRNTFLKNKIFSFIESNYDSLNNPKKLLKNYKIGETLLKDSVKSKKDLILDKKNQICIINTITENTEENENFFKKWYINYKDSFPIFVTFRLLKDSLNEVAIEQFISVFLPGDRINEYHNSNENIKIKNLKEFKTFLKFQDILGIPIIIDFDIFNKSFKLKQLVKFFKIASQCKYYNNSNIEYCDQIKNSISYIKDIFQDKLNLSISECLMVFSKNEYNYFLVLLKFYYNFLQFKPVEYYSLFETEENTINEISKRKKENNFSIVEYFNNIFKFKYSNIQDRKNFIDEYGIKYINAGSLEQLFIVVLETCNKELFDHFLNTYHSEIIKCFRKWKKYYGSIKSYTVLNYFSQYQTLHEHLFKDRNDYWYCFESIIFVEIYEKKMVSLGRKILITTNSELGSIALKDYNRKECVIKSEILNRAINNPNIYEFDPNFNLNLFNKIISKTIFSNREDLVLSILKSGMFKKFDFLYLNYKGKGVNKVKKLSKWIFEDCSISKTIQDGEEVYEIKIFKNKKFTQQIIMANFQNFQILCCNNSKYISNYILSPENLHIDNIKIFGMINNMDVSFIDQFLEKTNHLKNDIEYKKTLCQIILNLLKEDNFKSLEYLKKSIINDDSLSMVNQLLYNVIKFPKYYKSIIKLQKKNILNY